MFIFETSWEVCNRVGGIYTVLSTKAKVMKERYGDQIIFIGPDLGSHSDIFFKETKTASLQSLVSHAQDSQQVEGMQAEMPRVRIGRWQIPGKPIAVLLDYSHLWKHKDTIYGEMWSHFGVQSHAAAGDYDDSSLFGYAVGQIVEYLSAGIEDEIVLQCHEWQTAFALFYTRLHCPQIATLFTTHATGIGRSIAGNGKPLYDYFTGYHGNQMAQELGMVSKHSAEREAAHHAHCFTTVSSLTARECEQLLDKKPDIVTENGFELDLVPKRRTFETKRKEARSVLLQVAQQVTGFRYADDTTICCISGRAEWKNKGIDIFLRAIDNIKSDKPLLAFVMIPYLQMQHRIYANHNAVIFCPYYLNGQSGYHGDACGSNIQDALSQLTAYTYYDILIGMDITLFPSYYEPWGYTPHESVAFHVPTICTDLSGFGLWAQSQQDKLQDEPQQVTLFDSLDQEEPANQMHAVSVIHRTDSNEDDLVADIDDCLITYQHLSTLERERIRTEAIALSKKSTWEEFYDKYEQAYAIALSKIHYK